MIVGPKHHGEGREEQVEIAVHDGHEKGQEEDDRREDQHLDRTYEGIAPELARCETLIEDRSQSLVSGLELESARFASHDHDTVGLSHEDEVHERD